MASRIVSSTACIWLFPIRLMPICSAFEYKQSNGTLPFAVGDNFAATKFTCDGYKNTPEPGLIPPSTELIGINYLKYC